MQKECQIVTSSEVTKFLRKYDAEQRAALQSVRETIVSVLPGGEEVIAWSMPGIRISGDLVLSYCGFKNHNSIFPGAGSPVSRLGVEIEKFRTSKGALQFDRDMAFPKKLLREIIRFRVNEINASYPKKSGEYKEFFASGHLKLQGKMKNGERQGAWQFFRSDGSLLKVEQFQLGVKVKQS
jgi:uncharacterized protein YdhG (YjbR/CyaY superfamily)